MFKGYILSSLFLWCKIIGCGNSLLSEWLHGHNYQDSLIHGIDISENVIRQMNGREHTKSSNGHIIYEVMDCTQLTYPDNHFDFIFDKGTLDALACSDDNDLVMEKTALECIRVLKPGGKWVVVSFAGPERRKRFFPEDIVNISHQIIVNEALKPPGNQYHVYVLTKL